MAVNKNVTALRVWHHVFWQMPKCGRKVLSMTSR